MEKCQKCGSARILHFGGKCSDLSSGYIPLDDQREADWQGYMPDDVGIGGGDYIEGKLCLECGQLQGQWPLPKSKLEKDGE